MNSKTYLILYCMLKEGTMFDEIIDFANVSKDIIKYYKPIPEYSLDTLVFLRFFLPFYINLLYTDSWLQFLNNMKTPPCDKYKQENSTHMDGICELCFLFDNFIVGDDDNRDIYRQKYLRLEIAYNMLFVTKTPRVFIFEAIIITRNLKKFIQKWRLNKEI